MASSSSASGSGGAGRTPGPPKSLAQQFFDHRLLSRSNFPDEESLPTPLNMKKYKMDIPPRQTNLCLKMAIDFYNAQPDSSGKQRLTLERVVGIKSNVFILDNEDPLCYFHLYFKRETRQRKHYYFAELEGKNGPQRVRLCRQINKGTASAINCEHCFGGVLHPPEGFIGQRPAPFVGYRKN